MSPSLSIGFLGGVPPVLGGGGLELQMRRTRRALEGRGHRVVDVGAAGADDRLDVLHAFGAELTLLHVLPWWRRNRCPLVLSPVLSVRPGREAAILRLTAPLRFTGLSAAARRAVMARAAAVVVLTDWERGFVAGPLGVPGARVHAVSNGVDLLDPGTLPALPAGLPPRGYVLQLGAVTERKRQVEVIEALGDRPVAVAGAEPDDPAYARRFRAVAERPPVTWLGHVDDVGTVQRLERDAAALVLLSDGEVQSLSVLECLAMGTPAVLSDIPVHRELRQRHPDLVRLAATPADVPAAVAALAASPRTPAPIPTWDDVARALEAVYVAAGATAA